MFENSDTNTKEEDEETKKVEAYNFCMELGIPEDKAEKYLEENNWNTTNAANAYFEYLASLATSSDSNIPQVATFCLNLSILLLVTS